MSFDEFLKLKDPAQQLRILIEKNAWRSTALVHWSCMNSRINFKQQYAADGVRLAELLNPITEKI